MMHIKTNGNWITWISAMFKEFLQEVTIQPKHKIVDIYECKKTGFIKAIVQLSNRHTIEKNISDIVIDIKLLDGFDTKTIRTLTYMATVERLKPDYSIVVQTMAGEVEDYILEIKSKHDDATFKKSSIEITKDQEMLSKFTPLDANRIGYMAGVSETVKEYKLIDNIKANKFCKT